MNSGHEERWLPSDLEQRLQSFRGRLRKLKGVETAAAGFGVLVVSFALCFVCDRFFDTPGTLRMGLWIVSLASLLVLSALWWWRWVQRSRTLSELSRIVGRAQPMVGDRLLGVVELAQRGRDGQSSESLARAAIAQVSSEMQRVDWQSCIPEPRHRSRSRKAAGGLVLAAGLILVPGAGLNALERWIAPWQDTPRFTFARIAPFEPRRVVALGESFEAEFRLEENSAWQPRVARLELGDHRVLEAERSGGAYRFSIPPLVDPTVLSLSVGDDRQSVEIVPLARPELLALSAHIELPEYLERSAEHRDVRGGSLTVVRGSTVLFNATASRALASASWNGSEEALQIDAATLRLPAISVEEDSEQELIWSDIEGLRARQPFLVEVHARPDHAPELSVRGLEQEQVLLDEETITFTAEAFDDFGLRWVGLEWRGVTAEPGKETLAGERLVEIGGPESQQIASEVAFCAQKMGIEAQPLELRVFTQDYRPGSERVVSAQYRVYVLDKDQHMMWLTEQLRRWNQDVLEVRDEEERLYAQNQELRSWPANALASPDGRRELTRQAAAERANGRRLDSLAMSGEQLVQQAVRNSEFNVNTLETLARALEALRALANQRMPTVGQMLAAAAQAPSEAPSKPATSPSIVDQVPGAVRDESAAEPAKASPPSDGKSRLGLPTTTVSGPSTPSEESATCPPPGESALDPPLDEQAALLADFYRVLDDLAEILSNLHASTFVKRLKHVAHEERSLSRSLHDRLVSAFGVEESQLGNGEQRWLGSLAGKQRSTSEELSTIEEDLAAYFQRTRELKFDTVRRDIREQHAVAVLETMADALVANLGGDTVAEADYWGDELDRWAEILVGPG